MGYPESIKLTTVKPSGTLSLLGGSTPGIHPGFSKYHIRRVRLASDDRLVDACIKAGYEHEYEIKMDGSVNHNTIIISFPCQLENDATVAKDMSAVDQLEVVKRLQKDWSDNSVSVTVYYKKEELPEIKKWLSNNYSDNVKSVSFLLHSEHGFDQAPMEEITKEEYNKMKASVKPITEIKYMDDLLEDECEGGACPIR